MLEAAGYFLRNAIVYRMIICIGCRHVHAHEHASSVKHFWNTTQAFGSDLAFGCHIMLHAPVV